jgi:hypothetical protein
VWDLAVLLSFYFFLPLASHAQHFYMCWFQGEAAFDKQSFGSCEGRESGRTVGQAYCSFWLEGMTAIGLVLEMGRIIGRPANESCGGYAD